MSENVDTATGEVLDGSNLPAIIPDAPLPAVAADVAPQDVVHTVAGISEVPITPEESKALMVEPDPDLVEIREDGIVYMPEAYFRLRLTQVIGVGQWGLKAESPPIYDPTNCECVYDGSLWIRGRFVARAAGGCKWQPTNKKMTKTAALEGARSVCLRMCCKDLGIAAPLWMPSWIRAWKVKYAESFTKKDWKGNVIEAWRRKDSVGPVVKDGEPPGESAQPPPAAPRPTRPAPSPKPAPNAAQATANGPIPIPPPCPKCQGPMWDNRADREAAAADGKKVPAWKCKAGKWNKVTRKTDGCDGTYWPSDPNEQDGKAPKAASAPVPEGTKAVQAALITAMRKAAFLTTEAQASAAKAFLLARFSVEQCAQLTPEQWTGAIEALLTMREEDWTQCLDALHALDMPADLRSDEEPPATFDVTEDEPPF